MASETNQEYVNLKLRAKMTVRGFDSNSSSDGFNAKINK